MYYVLYDLSDNSWMLCDGNDLIYMFTDKYYNMYVENVTRYEPSNLIVVMYCNKD